MGYVVLFYEINCPQPRAIPFLGSGSKISAKSHDKPSDVVESIDSIETLQTGNFSAHQIRADLQTSRQLPFKAGNRLGSLGAAFLPHPGRQCSLTLIDYVVQRSPSEELSRLRHICKLSMDEVVGR